MRKYAKVLLAVCLIVLTLAGTCVTVFGAGTSLSNGWHKDSDGVERYYENGSYVTGKKQIGAHTYLFAEDGAFIRVVDAHKNVGTYGTQDTEAYKNAVSALGDKLYFAMPINTQSNMSNKSEKYISSGLKIGSLTSDTNTALYNGRDTSAYLNVVAKKTVAEFIPKGNSGDLALQIWQSTAGTDPFVNVNVSSDTPAGADAVFEMELKLGDGFNAPDSASMSLLQYIDRNHNGISGNNIFIQMLGLTSEGMVYATNYSKTKYVCKLTEEDYTRISVAIHPIQDTFDVYVNGVCVLSGVKFAGSKDSYDPSKAKAKEFRIAQFTNWTEDYGVNVCIDNVYVYGASQPVCTETAEPRNGVYATGGAYLRYYKDNLLVSGRGTVNGTYFGRTFSNESIAFDSHGKYFVGFNASMVIGSNVGKAEPIMENVFEAPKAIDVEGKIFIGWKITESNGSTVFLYPGQKHRVSGNIQYEPISIKYELMNGASVRTNADSTGLRFMAQIARSDYDMLVALGLDVKTHIMIVPTEYIEKTYGYTTVEAFEELEASGYAKRIDVAPNAWYQSTNNYYYYVGSVSNILSENYMLEYSGIAYLEITDSDGNVNRVYADYDKENNSRSVYEVASLAYNDRITSSKGDYSYRVQYSGKNTYSPYNASRLSIIKGFVDKVVMIDVDDSGVHSSGKYYEAPYAISVTGDAGEYTVKVNNNGSWKVSDSVGVVLNGKKLSSDEYTKTSSSYSLAVQQGVTNIKDTSQTAEVKKWYMANSGKSEDSALFSGSATFPTVAPNSDKTGFKWSFSKNTVSLFNSSRGYFGWNSAGSKKYTASYNSTAKANVVNLSDWQTLSFYYYADQSAVGSRFIILFYSENPASDGSDYYAYTVSVKSAGWNRVFLNKNSLSGTRNPLGWDKITSVSLSNTGWNMEDHNGDYKQVLYFTSMEFTDDSTASADLTIEQLSNAAAFYQGGYAASINSKKYIINPNNKVDAITFKDGDTYYLPLNTFASALATSATYYESGNVLKMKLGGVDYRFAEGKTYTKNGTEISLSKKAVVKGGRLFISAEDAMKLFGYSEMYVDRMGLIVLSNTPNVFDEEEDRSTMYEIIKELTFARPTGEQMYDDLMANSGGVHPYIMLDQADFDRLNYYKKKDATLKSYIARLATSYDVGGSVYSKAPVEYSLTDGVRLLAISREAMERAKGFSLLYKLYEFDDPSRAEQIAERLWKELESVCSFKDWHPAHYLDTAEMAYAVVLGYDWLYDYWVEYDKANGTNRLETIEEALYNYSLKTTTVLGGSFNLAGSTNNWNGVCNGGTMAAALALVTNPKYKDDAIKVMGASILAVEKGMWVYGPDGGYEEGPGYWSYGTTYLSVFMSSLDSACGTNYGLYYTPGFAHSVYFTTYLGSMNTTWGFHDGGSGSADTSIAAWFAVKSNDANVNAIRRQAIENGWKAPSWYDIIWFSPDLINNSITLDLDSYYSLDAIMTFRDSWDEKNSIFAGLHGGDDQASHGDLDIGNFIISVDGTHLICDLGSEKYNVAGYFGNYRWSYYRKRAEGQNTLVMLPHGESWDGKTGVPYADPITNEQSSSNKPVGDQKVNAVSKCLRYETGKNSALGVIDMKPAYSDYIASDKTAIRGLWFKDNRSTIIIQDEGTYKQGMDIWWFAHTKGNITVSEDGKSAIIEQNGIYLYAELVTNIANATFYVSDAESLDNNYVGDTTPSAIDPSTGSNYFKDDTEYSRDGITKLCVKATNVTEYKLAVVFKVIGGEDDVPVFGTTYTWTDIKDWKAE